MTKTYLTQNVYDAAQDRLKMIFEEFDNIFVSFSGGKDSGLLLNLCIQYMRQHGITKKIGVFHQDFEAQYSETTYYVERMMTSNLDLITPYWCCLPMKCKTATSMYEQYWIPWEPEKRDIWVRDMPKYDCVINIDNHQLDFYKYAMLQEDMYEAFSPWYHRHECGAKGKTICLVGIRAQESLNRWRAIANKDKATYTIAPSPTYPTRGEATAGARNITIAPLSPLPSEGEGRVRGGSKCGPVRWTTRIADSVYAGYPIYDWTADDIWIANAKCGFDYNKLYDLYHYAGLSVHQMRVASPFNDWAIGSLKLYRVIEPNIWGKMVGRVNGANFCAIYGETHAVGWKNIKLPKGHTWKSYVDFLLRTLPEDTRKTYEEKFSTSIKFWLEKGGCLSDDTINELQGMGVKIEIKGKTNYKTDKPAVSFSEYPDDLDVKEFQTVPSYKRMAICIMKNDHLCKYMGFSQTQKETQRRREAIAKYRAL